MSDSRKRFEEWAKAFGMPTHPHPVNPYSCYENQDATFAWQGWSARDSEVERLREALQRLCKSFPTDSDMAEAGWEGPEIDEACAAYDAARALLSSQDKESA